MTTPTPRRYGTGFQARYAPDPEIVMVWTDPIPALQAVAWHTQRCPAVRVGRAASCIGSPERVAEWLAGQAGRVLPGACPRCHADQVGDAVTGARAGRPDWWDTVHGSKDWVAFTHRGCGPMCPLCVQAAHTLRGHTAVIAGTHACGRKIFAAPIPARWRPLLAFTWALTPVTTRAGAEQLLALAHGIPAAGCDDPGVAVLAAAAAMLTNPA